MPAQDALIKDSISRTMGDEDGRCVQKRFNVSEIRSNLLFGLFVNPSHKTYRMLVPDEVVQAMINSFPMYRSEAFAGRIKINPIVIPHDVEQRHLERLQQVKYLGRIGGLRSFQSVELVRHSKQVSRQYDQVSVPFERQARKAPVDIVFSMNICKSKKSHISCVFRRAA